MDLLQTPNMQYPGFLSMLFRTLTRTCSSFNSSIFYISFQSSVINVLHFIWLSDILLLVKLVLSSLKYNLNKLLAFQFFINISFIWFYTLPGIHFPCLVIIVYKPSCSNKYVLLLISKFIFFYFCLFWF